MPEIKSGFIKQHQSFFSAFHKGFDIIIIWVSLGLCVQLNGVEWNHLYYTAAFIGSLFFYFTASRTRLYESWRGQSITLELGRVTKSWVITVAVLLGLAFIFKVTDSYSRVATGSWVIAAPLSLIIFRVILRLSLRHFRASGRNTKAIAIAGAGPAARALVDGVNTTPWSGINIAAFYDDKLPTGHRPTRLCSAVVEGTLTDLMKNASGGKYDEIYIALPMRAEKKSKQLIKALADTSIPVHIVPDFFTFNLLNSRIKMHGGVPAISVYDSPFDEYDVFVKRIEDVVLSSLILLMIAIPMISIALAIKLTSRGPVFFKQRRYGMSGEEISVWKFRSMTVCDDGDVVKQASKNDSRITPFGSFLRKTSLDELPQFINVLQGQMSIVGPRPHAVAHNELYRKEIDGYMQRHLVKPGITGWAQINGWRGETDTLDKMEKRIEYDLQYIRNWSLWLDLKIIFLTIFKGFVNKNAY